MHTNNLRLPFQAGTKNTGDGSIEIYGLAKSPNRDTTKVVFMADKVLCINSEHLSAAIKKAFGGDCIVVSQLNVEKSLGIQCYFTHDISGSEIRDAEALLRDVRSRLSRAINDVELP